MASPRVARALSELGFFVQHVGGENQPEKGSDDQTVLEHAKKINQTIVTDNHDLIVLCCEAEKSVVWLDPMDKDMTLAAQTLMCFGQIADWGTSLQQSGEALCIHARKTKCTAIPLDRARRLAINRGVRRRRTYARTISPNDKGDPLPGSDAWF